VSPSRIPHFTQDNNFIWRQICEENWDFVWDGEYVSAGAGGEDQWDEGG
jgi:hypothetical protein